MSLETYPHQVTKTELDHDLDIEKPSGLHYTSLAVPGIASTDVVYTDSEERKLVRRLDLWLLPILMISYGLQ